MCGPIGDLLMSFTPKTPAEADAFAAGFRAGYEARTPHFIGQHLHCQPKQNVRTQYDMQAQLAAQQGNAHLMQGQSQASVTGHGFYG